MKRFTNLLSLFALFTLLFIFACEDDEFMLPDSEPRITSTQQLRSMPGAELPITASITDPAGLASVSLTYAPWSIAEQVNLNGTETNYDFSYLLSVPSSAEMGSLHELTLSATNMNEVTFSIPLSLLLDLDVTMPAFVNQTPSGMAFLQEGPDVTLAFDATDDGEIATITVNGATFTDVVSVGSESFSYSRELDFQSEGVFDFEIVLTDNDGNETTETITIAAFEPFDAMYATDVTTDAELTADLFGVPAIMANTTGEDSTGKVFTTRYYSPAAGTEIRLLPSRETFSKLAVGASAGGGQLMLGTDATVSPIVLPTEGYYEIAVDLRDLSLSVASYEPTSAPFPLISVIGTGVMVNGESTCVSNADGTELCYNWGSGKQLTPDPDNPYRFSGEIELFDFDPVGTGNNGFILNANLGGWSPFWRFNVGDAIGLFPDFAVPNGGANFLFGPDAYGVYEATFDTELNLFTLKPLG